MAYLLSPDVTNPLARMTLVDGVGLPVEDLTGGVEIDHVETDADGIARLLNAEGLQLEQYPGIHGGVSWVEGRGAYGRCVVEGALVAFKPRPEDDACVYTLVRLP